MTNKLEDKGLTLSDNDEEAINMNHIATSIKNKMEWRRIEYAEKRPMMYKLLDKIFKP